MSSFTISAWRFPVGKFHSCSKKDIDKQTLEKLEATKWHNKKTICMLKADNIKRSVGSLE